MAAPSACSPALSRSCQEVMGAAVPVSAFAAGGGGSAASEPRGARANAAPPSTRAAPVASATRDSFLSMTPPYRRSSIEKPTGSPQGARRKVPRGGSASSPEIHRHEVDQALDRADQRCLHVPVTG